MKKFITIGEGVLMGVVALVLGSRKSIRAMEVVTFEHELKDIEERF